LQTWTILAKIEHRMQIPPLGALGLGKN